MYYARNMYKMLVQERGAFVPSLLHQRGAYNCGAWKVCPERGTTTPATYTASRTISYRRPCSTAKMAQMRCLLLIIRCRFTGHHRQPRGYEQRRAHISSPSRLTCRQTEVRGLLNPLCSLPLKLLHIRSSTGITPMIHLRGRMTLTPLPHTLPVISLLQNTH